MKMKNTVSYELLRMLAARAWDENDSALLEMASAAVDAAQMERLQDGACAQMQV